MAIVIRSFRESDRPILREMTAEAFAGVSIDENIDRVLGPVGSRDWRWRKGHHVDNDLAAPGGEISVAEDSELGRPVGYVSMRIDHEAGVGHIPNVVVAAGLRNQGLGRTLLEHALERFQEEGLSIARIETLDQNPIGSHLYPALGFREVARQIHFAMPLPKPGSPDND
jgi:ribosomal protein S18 acetylase RimI-like enzyme